MYPSALKQLSLSCFLLTAAIAATNTLNECNNSLGQNDLQLSASSNLVTRIETISADEINIHLPKNGVVPVVKDSNVNHLYAKQWEQVKKEVGARLRRVPRHFSPCGRFVAFPTNRCIYDSLNKRMISLECYEDSSLVSKVYWGPSLLGGASLTIIPEKFVYSPPIHEMLLYLHTIVTYDSLVQGFMRLNYPTQKGASDSIPSDLVKLVTKFFSPPRMKKFVLPHDLITSICWRENNLLIAGGYDIYETYETDVFKLIHPKKINAHPFRYQLKMLCRLDQRWIVCATSENIYLFDYESKKSYFVCKGSASSVAPLWVSDKKEICCFAWVDNCLSEGLSIKIGRLYQKDRIVVDTIIEKVNLPFIDFEIAQEALREGTNLLLVSFTVIEGDADCFKRICLNKERLLDPAASYTLRKLLEDNIRKHPSLNYVFYELGFVGINVIPLALFVGWLFASYSGWKFPFYG